MKYPKVIKSTGIILAGLLQVESMRKYKSALVYYSSYSERAFEDVSALLLVNNTQYCTVIGLYIYLTAFQSHGVCPCNAAQLLHPRERIRDFSSRMYIYNLAPCVALRWQKRLQGYRQNSRETDAASRR